MNKLLCALFMFLLSAVCFGEDSIKINEVSTEYRNTNCGHYCNFRHSFLDSEKELNYSIIQNTSISIYKYFLLENRFFFDGSSKVDFAGLEYRAGLDIPISKTSSIGFGKWHHSSHALDKEVRDGRFPLTDAIYLKIDWYKRR